MKLIAIVLTALVLLTGISEADAESGRSKNQNAASTQKSPQAGFSAGSSIKKGGKGTGGLIDKPPNLESADKAKKRDGATILYRSEWTMNADDRHRRPHFYFSAP